MNCIAYKRLFIGFLLIMPFPLFAQTLKKQQEARVIIQQRNIYLNGGARSSVGGKSRTAIEVQLPQGTIAWYYSFTTTLDEQSIKSLDLFAQVSSILLDPSGTVASQISVPPGSGSVDVFILEGQNSNLFLQKVDLDGGTFYYSREGSVENTKQAIVEITNRTNGTFYLGLKNPSTFIGINVFIEVVAIVETYEEQSQEQIQAMTCGNLGWKAFERGDYNRCIELSEKALSLDNSLGFVHFNIALSYLITGRSVEAVTAYSKAISVTRESVISKRTFEGAIKDLYDYMDKFPVKDEAVDILNLLVEEVKKH